MRSYREVSNLANMALSGFALLTLAVLLAPVKAVAYPFAGYDSFPTTAEVEIYDPGDQNILLETITMSGDAVVYRGDPYDPGDGRMRVDTRLDTLLLRGISTTFLDSIFVVLNRATISVGYIQQVTAGVDYPAESFFDVYYVISVGSEPQPPLSPAGAPAEGAPITNTLRHDSKYIVKAPRILEIFSEPLTIERTGEIRHKPDKPEFSALPDGPVSQISVTGLSPLQGSAAVCDGEWQGPGAILLTGWYFGAETYATYQDPDETGCLQTYPFEVQNVYWDVSNETGAQLDLNIMPVIYEVDNSDPDCEQRPGAVKCQGQVYTVSLPAGFIGIIALPITCCVNGPYFAGVICPDVNLGALGFIVDDPAPNPARGCSSYNDYGFGWEDLVNLHSWPWNLRLWSDGQSSEDNNCENQLFINLIPPHMEDTIWGFVPNGPGGREYKDPRKVPIVDPLTGQIIGYIRHKHKVKLVGGNIPAPTWGFMWVWVGPNPPSPSQPPDEIIELYGTATLNWGDEYINQFEQREVQTEILSMDLSGQSSLFGPAYLHLPFPAPGQVTSQGTGEFFPAESFFDVFYQVTFPFQELTIEPMTPPRMSSIIEALPPLYEAQYEDPEIHPIHDISNPGIPIGWVRPIHIVHPPDPPPSGACCDDKGNCRVTSQGACLAAGDDYQGDGTSCTPNPCPQPPPPDRDCFLSVGKGTITLDPADLQCLFGAALSLSSGFEVAEIEVDPAPYTTGTDIQTEIVAMSLSGSDPLLGEVIVRERADKQSLGKITNVVASGGNFVSGDSYFDVFYEVEIPDAGLTLNTGNIPMRMEATITQLPPAGEIYFPPPTAPPLQLFDEVTSVHIGWFCHAEHQPTEPIDCESLGACCLPDETCVITDASLCQAAGGVFQGAGIPCDQVDCAECCDLIGDIDGDGVAYTTADAVRYADYFVNGIGVLGDLCLTNTDINGDGIVLAVADLNLLIIIINAGAEPVWECDDCCVVPGDANHNGTTNIADAIFLLNRIFGVPTGPKPPCCEEADANGNGSVNIADAIYIINRVFGTPSGPAPICGPTGMTCGN